MSTPTNRLRDNQTGEMQGTRRFCPARPPCLEGRPVVENDRSGGSISRTVTAMVEASISVETKHKRSLRVGRGSGRRGGGASSTCAGGGGRPALDGGPHPRGRDRADAGLRMTLENAGSMGEKAIGGQDDFLESFRH